MSEENKISEEVYVRYDGRVEKKMDYHFHLFPSVMDMVIDYLKRDLREIESISTKDDPLVSLELQNISEFIDGYYKILKSWEK